MRRFAIFGCLIAILVSLAVPCFANSSVEDVPYYSVLQFDEVRVPARYGRYFNFPFPFNVAYSEGDASYGEFDYSGSDLLGYYALAWDNQVPSIVGTIGGPAMSSASGGDYNYVEFYARDKIVDVGALTGKAFVEYDRTDVRIINCRLDVEYYVPSVMGYENEVSERIYEHTLDTETFSHTEAYYPDQYIDIAYQFRRLSSAIGQNLIAIKEMKWTICYQRVTVATTYFDFHFGAVHEADMDYWLTFDNYIDTLHLGMDVEEVIVTPPTPLEDTMTWLTSTVESFLNTEFFPNFSISKLIMLILVIGIVLWFITLLI